jgi:hypothetical protein
LYRIRVLHGTSTHKKEVMVVVDSEKNMKRKKGERKQPEQPRKVISLA